MPNYRLKKKNIALPISLRRLVGKREASQEICYKIVGMPKRANKDDTDSQASDNAGSCRIL